MLSKAEQALLDLTKKDMLNVVTHAYSHIVAAMERGDFIGAAIYIGELCGSMDKFGSATTAVALERDPQGEEFRRRLAGYEADKYNRN